MQDRVWQSPSLVATYLEGVRRAVPLAAEQIDVMLRIIAAAGRPVQKFLDLGCGDGVLSAAIIDRWPDASGVLLDFSEPMLAAARERFRGRDGKLAFQNADYGDPSWTDGVSGHGPFDAVVSGFSIHHQPDGRKRDLYAEIFHLVAPGGTFINVEHVASASRWVESLFDQYMIDAFHAHHGSSKSRDEVAREYYHRPDKTANILALVETQCDWLRQIGFQDVDCYLKVFELAVFGGRRR